MSEQEERDLNVGDGILGPEDEGSMAFKLARAAEAPQAQVQLSPEEIEAARQAELEAEGIAAAAAADEAAAAAADGTKAGDAPEPPKFKFDTLEDYDKALKAAETRMHTATTETSEERKAREALEAEVAELRAAQEARDAEAARPAAIEANKAAYAEALKKIKAIPVTQDAAGNLVYPDDYDDQVAAAWASTAPDPEKIIEEVTKRAEAKEAARRVAADAATAEQREADESARIAADAEKLAADAGLDMTPGSADYRLFYSHVDELKRNPKHEYRDKPFEEQVAWAAGGVRQILGQKIELTDAERAAARRTQTRNSVLERGVTRVAPAEPKRQRTMAEMLGQAPTS